MASDYAKWYRVGNVSVTKGSKEVSGSETFWLSSGAMAGDMFSTDNGATFYEIAEVKDNTHLTLKTAYTQNNDAATQYSIVRNFTATMPAQVAAKTAELVNDMARYVDTDMQSLTGRSAFDSAKKLGFTGTESEWLTSLSAYGRARANGYSGTEAQWLESLKAAGEWSKLDARTEILTEGISREGLHNSLVRGKFLGNAITDEQYARIKNGSYQDMWLGDYWDIAVPNLRTVRARIIDFGYYRYAGPYSAATPPAGYNAMGLLRPHLVLQLSDSTGNGLTGTGELADIHLKDRGSGCVMNDTATTEGGFAGTKMYKETLPRIQGALEAVLGEKMLYFSESLCNAVKDGKESGYIVRADLKVMIPAYIQVFGYANEERSKFYTIQHWQYAYYRQMGIFGAGSNGGAGGPIWWLRTVSGAQTFWSITPYNPASPSMKADLSTYAAPDSAWGKVSPVIVIG